MLTRENSVTLSLRVLKSDLAEFRALCVDLGEQPSTRFRRQFTECLRLMRAESDARRARNDMLTWAAEWELVSDG